MSLRRAEDVSPRRAVEPLERLSDSKGVCSEDVFSTKVENLRRSSGFL